MLLQSHLNVSSFSTSTVTYKNIHTKHANPEKLISIEFLFLYFFSCRKIRQIVCFVFPNFSTWKSGFYGQICIVAIKQLCKIALLKKERNYDSELQISDFTCIYIFCDATNRFHHNSSRSRLCVFRSTWSENRNWLHFPIKHSRLTKVNELFAL